MKNKEIQEARMRQYFLEATSEILKAEGISAVSVRNVAQRAGYSYATLYNYFRDINDLVFLCVKGFQEECREFVKDFIANTQSGKQSLKKSILGYVGYFVQYPGIFELFYLTRVGDFGQKQDIINTIGNSLDAICEDQWKKLVEQGKVSEEQTTRLKSIIRYAVVGLLVLYLNRRIPESYNDFLKETQNMLEVLLLDIKD